jgi:hypothetical protein
MAKTSKSNEINIDDATFFKGAVIAALVLSGLVYGSEILRGIFLSDFGLYANLAVLFYLLAFGYGLKGISGINLENWEKFRPLAVLSFLALVMAAEELRWGLPFLQDEDAEWRIQRMRDLISMALVGIPEKSSLWMAGVVAGTRLLLILMVIYAIGFAVYYRARLAPLWRKFRSHKAFLYACFFIVFFLLTVVLTAEQPALFAMLGGYLRMGAALSFLMMVLKLIPRNH